MPEGPDGTFRPLRLGMVGGGLTGGIGAAHRIAARMHGLFELVAGAFSSDADTAHRSAAALGVARERSYESYEEMARVEGGREAGIEVVSIVTPNDLHVVPAIAFAQAGIDVVCDKPLSDTYARAQELERAVTAAGVEFVLTHNYSGYTQVREARQQVAAGLIGELRSVRVKYLQDGLLNPPANPKRRKWRGSKERCGPGGTIADIGSHAYQLARFVTGVDAEAVAADFTTFSEDRELDDHCEMLLRFPGGARGSATCSQVSVGRKCDLNLNVYGSKGSLHWRQEFPNELTVCGLGAPQRVCQRGMPYLGEHATPASNITAGHTEGNYEAFAQIYPEAHNLVCARRYGTDAGNARDLVPGLADGLAVARFINAAVKSAANGVLLTGLSSG